ncbi:MAG: 16S rRNA (guanine(527)-N(7))-methyltransferase RsmG, partial [Methylophilaceae bacterium]
MSAQQVLLQGIAQLGLVIDEDKRQKLLAYVQMISKWNKVHNLTAIRDEVSMMTLHILDSLVTLPLIQQDEHILDVGSGAGLPGIVIAICKPDVQVKVIDASQKKASFMRQVKAELDLQNLTVLAGRVEQQMIATPFDSIISRAFSDLKTFISLTQGLLKKQGRWLAM